MVDWSHLVRSEVKAGRKPSFVVGFTITGVLKNGKRFKPLRKESYELACMINLWNGSIWANTEDGRRVLIKRVIN